MNKRIIIIASVFGILAVILGAFGAHALKARLTTSELEVWKTAVDYQFYHTFALLFLSTFSRFNSRGIKLASWFFSLGIILFSGSLNISQISVIGPITPIGGLFFIMGWISLIIATIKNK